MYHRAPFMQAPSEESARLAALRSYELLDTPAHAALDVAGRGAGHGPGLSFYKLVTDAHGGRIGVRSTEAGNRFFVELPAP